MSTMKCSCGTALKIKPEMAGKQIRCPTCKSVMSVPADAAAETLGISSDASLAPADPPSANRPRLRSEAMRATTPVTSVQATSASEGPVVKTVAAVVPNVAAATIAEPPPVVLPRNEPPPLPAAPPQPLPETKPRQPRVSPPLPPPVVPPRQRTLPEAPVLDADGPAFSLTELEPSALGFPAPPRIAPQPPVPPAIAAPAITSPAAVRASLSQPATWPKSWWIGAGATAVLLLILAFQMGRRGVDKPPAKPLVAEELATAQQPVATKPHTPAPPERVRPTAVPRTADSAAEETPPRTKPPQRSRPPAEVEEDPGQAVRTVQAPPRSVPPPRGGNSLSGVSRQYDDLDCQRIQAQHSVRVPSAANILEVDGQRLPLANLAALAECPAPCLYLPRGKHAVKFRKNELPLEVTVASDLSQVYYEMRQFFNAGEKPREAELLSRGAKALDVHNAPFLLNLMGAAHVGKDQSAAAQRKFRRALRVNPLFAPAHLNLAALLYQQGAKAEARQELQLAEATNVGNCFGLSPGIYEVRRQMGLPPGPTSGNELALSSYVAQEPLSEEDLRMTALMQGLAKYAVENAERGKIINNLAIHFADQGNNEQALDHFRSALAVLKLAGPERYKLAQHVLTQMGETCRKAKYEEADEYDRMRSMVQP